MKFEEVVLGDYCEILSSKRIYAKEYQQCGIPFYRSKEIIQKANNNLVTTELFISKERFEEIRNKFGIPTEGDILLTSVGTLGVPYLVQNEEFYFKDGNLTWFTRFSTHLNNEYLYYWFSSKLGKNEIDRITIGSTQKALTIVNLKSLKISLPPVNIQMKIVSVLKSIDEKLKSNLKQIAIMEQLSQALFKHWFINFEFPNEQGQPYKSSGGEMVESELGEIPKGWPVYKLDEFVESISNSIKKKEQPLARFLNTSDILNGEIMHKELDEVANMPGQAKKLIQKGDILYSEIRPKNKRHAYISFDSDEYVVSTKLMVLRVNETVYSGKVLYQWLASDTVINEFQQLAEDRSGTFPQITFSTIGHYKFAIPPIDIKDKLFNPLELMLDKRLNLINENKKLAELRDTLLPKLLSGEIEIPDELVVD